MDEYDYDLGSADDREARRIAEYETWKAWNAPADESEDAADLDADCDDRDSWDDPLPGEMTEYDYLDHTGY